MANRLYCHCFGTIRVFCNKYTYNVKNDHSAAVWPCRQQTCFGCHRAACRQQSRPAQPGRSGRAQAQSSDGQSSERRRLLVGAAAAGSPVTVRAGVRSVPRLASAAVRSGHPCRLSAEALAAPPAQPSSGPSPAHSAEVGAHFMSTDSPPLASGEGDHLFSVRSSVQ